MPTATGAGRPRADPAGVDRTMRSVRLLHPRAPGERPWSTCCRCWRSPSWRGPPSPCPGTSCCIRTRSCQYLEPAHRLVFGNGDLLGVLLARSWSPGWWPGCWRCATPPPGAAVLVRGRRQAAVLRGLPAGSGRDVLVRAPAPARRRRGSRCWRRVLRAGRFRAQADDGVRGDGPAGRAAVRCACGRRPIGPWPSGRWRRWRCW